MDIRDIQALHAQYAAQPVVIDINGHVQTLRALPAPEGKQRGTPIALLRGRRFVKPVAIAVAIAALAAVGGISTAKLWRVLRVPSHGEAPLATPAAASAPPAARLLTAADFGAASGTPAAGRAGDESGSLGTQVDPRPAETPPRERPTPADLTNAETSPIRAPQPAPTAPIGGPVTTRRPAPSAGQPANPPKEAPRHLRTPSPQPHAVPGEKAESTAPAPTSPTKATGGKSGDVQIF